MFGASRSTRLERLRSSHTRRLAGCIHRTQAGLLAAGTRLDQGWPVGCAAAGAPPRSSTAAPSIRSEEHTSELQSLMRISYAVFCLKKKTKNKKHQLKHVYQQKNNTKKQRTN